MINYTEDLNNTINQFDLTDIYRMLSCLVVSNSLRPHGL